MGLPNIVINFVEMAETAIARLQKGIVAIVVKDATGSPGVKMYHAFHEVQLEEYSAENLASIKDAFVDGPTQVYVIKIGAEQTFVNAKEELDKIRANWMCFIDKTQTGVADYVKARNAKSPMVNIKAAVFQDDAADDSHVVNFTNSNVTRRGEEPIEGFKYLGRIAGLLAALPMSRTATNYELKDLEGVVEVKDANADIDAGKLVLINDYGSVRIGRGVNTLKSGKEALKKISTIEIMDLIKADITKAFKDNYCGQYKNSLDNQKVFISAINVYFKGLADEGILDPNYQNEAIIDVEKQRKKIIESGVEAAREWSPEEVEKNTYSSYIFLKGKVKILDGIEDLEFDISMN